jgi:DNA-binding protein HU-beta
MLELVRQQQKKALECMLIEIEGALQKGNRVSLVGFGSWPVAKRDVREGRNPQTGKTIKIKAKKIVKFKPSETLLDTDDTGPMKAN